MAHSNLQWFMPKINPPLAPPLGLALLVLSTLVLVPAALHVAPVVVALVALDIVALVVLPPSLVQVVGPTPSCKLLSDIFISSASLWLIIYLVVFS